VVQTVSGEIPADQLGFTLVHEHVFYDVYEITLNSNMIGSDIEVARDELKLFKESGGKTLVDQTSHGLNPEPERLRTVAEETGVQIVAGTGFYWERYHPDWMATMSERDLTDLVVRDLTEGINGTDVRAGIIGEIGTGHRGISAAEERAFRACAAAQREVPVPISTHSLFTHVGMDQLNVLESAGADLDHVLIGHVDTTPEVDYHDQLLRRGVWIGYDSVGQLDKQTDERRAASIAELVKRGHIGRILVSSDVGKRAALSAYGGQGYSHVAVGFLPLLRDAGLTDDQIDTLMVQNPKNYFTFA
jgi:phosphotriesterase-related protein